MTRTQSPAADGVKFLVPAVANVPMEVNCPFRGLYQEQAACPPETRGWAFLSTSLSGYRALRDLLDRVTAVLGASSPPPPSFVVVLGSGVDPRDFDQAMFCLGANADFVRDMRIVQVRDRHVALFDATPKHVHDGYPLPVRAWPPILEMDRGTRDLVTRRWCEYGLPQD